MPATKTELKERDDFRGDILDREFPVHFDTKTGAYSYNYADVPPELESAIKNIKYFRVSSPSLAEVEEELVKHSRKEGPAPPPVKGNITKATEAQVAALKNVQNVGKPLFEKQSRGETLTPEETSALNKSTKMRLALERPQKAQEAKRIYNEIQDFANEKGVNVNALRKKLTSTPVPPLSADESTVQDVLGDLDRVIRVIDAYELLERLEEKVKEGKTLNAKDLADKTAAETLLNATPRTNKGEAPKPLAAKVEDLKEKQKYNNARGLITQIMGTPENSRTARQLKNLSDAKAIVGSYEAAHPEAVEKSVEKNFNLFFAEATKYGSKRNAAQKALNALAAKKNLSPGEQASRTKLQGILNAYRTFHDTNPFINQEEKKAAEAILKAAPNNTNNTPSLKGIFPNMINNTEKKGGRRHTRKQKKSKKRTHKRKH
jgi:hypothetical protein